MQTEENGTLKYVLKRYIYYEIKDGYYLEDLQHKKTGFFFCEEMTQLEKGQELTLQVESTDGEFGVDFRTYNPNETFLRKLFKSETVGQIVDYQMREHPFDKNEIVSIKMRRKSNYVEIHLTAINK